MKRHIQCFTLGVLLIINSTCWGQIQQNDTSICIGNSVNLNCNSPFSVQSCTGTSALNYADWTAIASNSSYWNIIKEGSSYFLRSDTDVYQSSSLNGPWTSLGFNTQIGNTLAGRMLGQDWSNRLIVSTGHNALYALNNGTWSDIGLSGSGCSGNFIHKLANNRIIVMKAGFLRDLYISDNNGTTWTNVTNVDNDYWDMIVAANGNIFACGGSNTLSMTGIIKSTNNGSSFTQINAQLGGISRCSGLSKDCDNNLYAVGDNKIFKSTDNGTTWANHCIIPSYFTTNPGGSFLVIASNGDYYFWSYSNNSMHGLFRSSNQGQTWTQITDLPTSTANVRTIKEIDGNIVISTSQGIFARTLTPNNTYMWSTGETTSSINVQPSQTTEYFVTVTSSIGVVVNDSITIFVSNPQVSLGVDQSICSGNQATLASLDNGFSSYNWNNGETSSSISVNQAGQYVLNIIDSNGCSATDTVNVAIINPTISAGSQAFYLGDSTTLNIYNNNTSIWWSDGTTNQSSIQVQPTQTTTYSVTVSDGVGTCTDSITIQVNNPQINAGSDLSVCEGETATLTATGGDTYSWDNGVVNGQAFVPTVEGYYTVKGTDTLGCSNTVSVYLDILQPTSSTISPTSCNTYTAPDNAVYTNSGQYHAIIPNAAGCDSTITINLTLNNSNSGTYTKFACDTFTWIDGITYTESNNTATFTLQNASGCDSVVTLNLTLNKLQNLNAGSDQ